MKKSIIILLAGLLCLGSCQDRRRLSVDMVESEMARCIDAAHLDGMEGRLKWNYTTGLELKSFLDVYETYGNDSIYNYAEGWYDAIISEDGSIGTYKKEKFNTDHVCPGRTLIFIYEKSGKAKYRLALDRLRDQLNDHPRTSEGGFWHKQTYPWQMWLDGLYMAQPFYAEYNSKFGIEEQKDSIYRDIINHFMVVARHTYDPATGLYRHAWDESGEMFWCDSESGQSAHAWGRALGWYVMAIVDVLDWIPSETEGRDGLVQLLRGIYEVLPQYADKETGMWYQVLDCPGREGNYVEATCSAMFTYAALKGVRMGYLDSSLEKWARGLYDSLVKTFIEKGEDGLVNLTRCCAVAGLGGKENRSGDYAYYINERICDNDPKGVGPFIWASLEMEKYR